jgi:hypothetical protein
MDDHEQQKENGENSGYRACAKQQRRGFRPGGLFPDLCLGKTDFRSHDLLYIANNVLQDV